MPTEDGAEKEGDRNWGIGIEITSIFVIILILTLMLISNKLPSELNSLYSLISGNSKEYLGFILVAVLQVAN